MSERTRSPLKEKPLRTPGQSLREERQALWDDKIEPALLLALFMVLLAALEWFRHFRGLPPMPGLMSVAAAGASCATAEG